VLTLGLLAAGACSKNERTAPPSPALTSQAASRPSDPSQARSRAPAPSGAQEPESNRSREQLLDAIEALRQGGKTKHTYVVPSPEELTAYRRWVKAVLVAARAGQVAEDPAPDGFELRRLVGAVLLAEARDRRRGAGAVVVRLGQARELIVQVPHSFYDEGTLVVGEALFSLGHARALAVNTIHRYRTTGGRPPSEADPELGDGASDAAESDVAHAPESFFLAFHEEASAVFPQALAVQLHGYADASVPGFDVVLSGAGTRFDPAPLTRALAAASGLRVAAYPKDVRRLGGTSNQQARASRSLGREFLHVEMARGTRQRLVDEPLARRRFVEALWGTRP
jgi:hypothetical protein